jgi:hypothetical protein
MPTVNRPPSVKETADALTRLGETVRTTVTREAERAGGLKADAERRERRRAAAAGRIRREQEEALGERRAEFARQRDALTTKVADQEERIRRATEATRRFRKKQVEEEEGRAKFRIQREQLQNSRHHEQALKEAQQTHEAFLGELAAEEHVLLTLEVRARDTLGGYRSLARRLDKPPPGEPVELPGEPPAQLDALRSELVKAEQNLRRLRRLLLPILFRHFPLWLLWLLVLGGHAAAVYLLPEFDRPGIPLERAGYLLAFCTGGLLAVWGLGRWLSAGPARLLAKALATGHDCHAAIQAKAGERHEAAIQRIEARNAAVVQSLDERWTSALAQAEQSHATWSEDIAIQAARTGERHRRLAARREAALRERQEAAEATLVQRFKQKAAEADAAILQEEAGGSSGQEGDRGGSADESKTVIAELSRRLTAGQEALGKVYPPWTDPAWSQWQSRSDFDPHIGFGRLRVDVDAVTGGIPSDSRLQLPLEKSLELPLTLVLPTDGTLVLETGETGRSEALATLTGLMLRLLAWAPPGKVDFTLLDPVGLGESFAGFMHLADYEEQLINNRIWTQAGQIEERLAALSAHIEKVTQMYLRNEYATIADFNAEAGRMAEKYRFLVIADFPTGFTEIAASRLLSVLSSGPRCGVFTWLHWDRRKPLPVAVTPEDLHGNAARIRHDGRRFLLDGAPENGVTVELDGAPPPALATELLHRIGKSSIDASRVEVPFAGIAPGEKALWSETTGDELRVPVGVTGATKQQFLALGKATRQHVLIAGKTGSGKSNLFHVIITNLSLWCSPDQVEFYLVDFKKGVEFKCYGTHRLPHARVVAIESDREFGLSVLQRVDEEMRRRGELYRRLGVQDLPGYQRAGGGERLPRTLLIIDEFQEFFTEDDRVAQTAAMLLDRIVRQGRAFGIHVLLGSQTLGGAYTLARTTLGQMVVRVALQCNEADAYLVMDEDNPAPRLLSRPGEAIYNDAAGRLEGNSPFQVVWLDDATRDEALRRVRERAVREGLQDRAPLVFEGNAPADVRENALLRQALSKPVVQGTAVEGRAWLGAPNAIKGPTEAVFERQSGNHLLIVGQRDEEILAMLGFSTISLAAQFSAAGARFVVLSRTPADSAERRFLERIAATVPQATDLVRGGEVGEALGALTAELDRRGDPALAETAPPVYVLVHELARFKELRQEDEFSFSLDDSGGAPSPAAQFQRLVSDGAAHGIHLICTCDSGNTLGRFLNRKAMSEFEMRVVFQMSANDSAMLIDTPKANALGLYRAIFHDGQEGVLETFRPYAMPDPAWLEEVASALKQRG